MTTISYAITACNEHVELERLLDQINEHIRPEDEVIVQLDNTATDEVKKVANKYNVGTKYEYHRIIFPLNSDFAAFKNNLKQHCTRDYIFFIDADEYIAEHLLKLLPQVLEHNKVDLISVPRVNTVEGLTEGHIKKWGWFVNDKGWVNFPDYQTRICKNIPEMRWEGKVHERLTGAKLSSVFPQDLHWSLFHPKHIDRQEKQNQFYNLI